MQTINQRNVTRNQSTADFEVKRIFIFDNRFKEIVFKNGSGSDVTLKPGNLIVRDTTTPTQGVLATSSTFQNVIGVCATGDVVVPAGGTLLINIGTKGTIDGNALQLPASVTLNSVPTDGVKSLTDFLEDIGLHVDTSTVEMTKFDN